MGRETLPCIFKKSCLLNHRLLFTFIVGNANVGLWEEKSSDDKLCETKLQIVLSLLKFLMQTTRVLNRFLFKGKVLRPLFIKSNLTAGNGLAPHKLYYLQGHDEYTLKLQQISWMVMY